MGYTHTVVRTLGTEPADAYGRLALDTKAILAAIDELGLPIVGVGGATDTLPDVDEGGIWLNGDSATGDDCEGFAWPADLVGAMHAELADAVERGNVAWANHISSQFAGGFVLDHTKTGRRPYDLAVCSILIRAKVHYGESIEVRSDGDWEHEWQRGAMGWGPYSDYPAGPGGYHSDGGDGRWGIGAAELCARLFGEAVNPLAASALPRMAA